MMTDFHAWIDPRVKVVRTGHLLSYLRKRGWTEEGTVRQHFHRFRHPAKNGLVLVPTAEETDDQPQRIFEAVTQLAKIEDRYAGDVLGDLLSQSIAETDTKPGLAPVSRGVETLAVQKMS